MSIEYSKKLSHGFHRERLMTIDNSNMNIEMNNHILTKVNFFIYLNKIVDHKLNYLDHITYVKDKIF